MQKLLHLRLLERKSNHIELQQLVISERICDGFVLALCKNLSSILGY